MPLKLSVLSIPETTQFEALIVRVPEGIKDTTESEVLWSDVFDTEEEASMVGQEELEELKAESE